MRLLLQGHHSSSSSLALAVRWSLLLLLAGSGSPALCCYTRIFSFGDSLTDTGNYVRLTARSPSPYGASPYGRTFFSRPSPPAARATAASSSTSSVGSQSELMTLPSTDERKNTSNQNHIACEDAPAIKIMACLQLARWCCIASH
jgi:phospholipase/lecithinase/hemolysin